MDVSNRVGWVARPDPNWMFLSIACVNFFFSTCYVPDPPKIKTRRDIGTVHVGTYATVGYPYRRLAVHGLVASAWYNGGNPKAFCHKYGILDRVSYLR